MGYRKKQCVNAMCPLVLWILRALPKDCGCLLGLIGTKHSCRNALIIMLFIYNFTPGAQFVAGCMVPLGYKFHG